MAARVNLSAYQQHLVGEGFAERTIESYLGVAATYLQRYGEVDIEHLHAFREGLVQSCKPSTVNQRVHALNHYLRYLGKADLTLHTLRLQGATYAQDAIGDGDCARLTAFLREGGYLRDYCAVRLMATTGMRVSELLQLEVSHIRVGYLDTNSKGKVRRIHIPDATRAETLEWLEREGRTSGQLLLNRYGRPISARGLAYQLKVHALQCGIDADAVHPHAFRHLFARRFLEAGGDIAFLADLLGHSSVNTTRIYLRRTSSEQHEELNRLMTW